MRGPLYNLNTDVPWVCVWTREGHCAKGPT